MKAIILARVSTKEQEEGHSINAQRQRLADYCARKSLEVIRTFELIESSTRGERKEFMVMLDFAGTQKETVAIVADAVDRFQRSFKESVLIDELIRREQVELHFYREGMVIGKNASSTDILRWDFSVMGAKSYVLNLSENVRRSLEFKRRNGEWSGKAPLGYLNSRDANNKSTLIHDPERAFLVRMLFEDYAKGCFSISGDLLRRAREWGLTNKTRKGPFLTAGQIHNILTNPFYYGEMRIKGKLYPHVYEPLISKDLFDRCEGVRLEKSRPTATRYSEKPFVFRGLLKCAVSQRVVTSDMKKGRYVYLICRDPADPGKKLFVPEGEVLEQVLRVFQSIQIPEKLLDALLAHMKASHEAENQFHLDTIAGLRRDYDQNRERLATLLDLRLDKSITQDEYDKKAHELKERQAEVALRIEQHQEGEGSFQTTLESLISVASRAAEIFERSNIEQKRQLIAFVFSNLNLRGKKLEFSLRSPFDLMVDRRDYGSWLGLRDSILFNGGLANTLDYDDTYTPTLNHISGGAVPLVLALGAREGASGRDVLLAYLVAIEIGAHVGLGVGGNAIMRRGFSPTGTLNGFGNGLAAGRLLGLDRDALIGAQGIALTLMSGSMEGIKEGAWSKRLNSGLGAIAGLNAAMMAAEGVHAPSRPYEGDAGLYRLLLGPDAEVEWASLTDGLGTEWEFEKVGMKPFPLVHHAHSIVDIAIRLNREDGVRPGDIEAITVLVDERQVPLLCEPDADRRHPPNAHAGIFSIYHLAATALARGRMTLDECEEEALHDPEIRALRDRIRYEIHPDSMFPRYFSGGLTARLQDGRVIKRYEPHHLGSDKRPLPADAAVAKFRNNAGRLYAEVRVDAIVEAVMALDSGGAPEAVTALLGAP